VLHAVVAAEDFGHSGFPREAHPLAAHGGGAPGEPLPGFDLGRHLGQHELDRLQIGERFAELDAAQSVSARGIESGAGEAERNRSDIDAGHVEAGHGDLEPLSLLAKQVLARNPHALEGHSAERVAELAELPFGRPDCHPKSVALDQEHGHAACAQRAIEGAEDHEGVGDGREGNRPFRAVEHVAIAVAARGRRQ
jgi:hypothetical protein